MSWSHRLPQVLEREWWLDVAENQLADADAWQRVSARDGAPPAASGGGQAISDALEALPPIGLARPRSRCPSLRPRLRWHENIPLLGWLRLKGRCSACGTRISTRYPLVELATGAAVRRLRLEVRRTAADAGVVRGRGLAGGDGADRPGHHLLPDDLTLPLIGLGLLGRRPGLDRHRARSRGLGRLRRLRALWRLACRYKLAARRGRHGRGRLQAAGRSGRLLGWQMSAVDRAAGLGCRRGGRHRADRLRRPQARGADLPSAPTWPAAASRPSSSARALTRLWLA